MFMLNAAALATPADAPDPVQDPPAEGASERISGILGVVRKLVDFGRQLVGVLRQGSNAGSDRTALADIKLRFSTLNVAAILARITRGLELAAALETRLEKWLARTPAAPASAGDRPERQPRAASLARPRNGKSEPEIPGLPSAAAIAARLRQRPIGVVLADICRDLGIVPSDPIWRELFLPILGHGGNPSRLAMDSFDRRSEGFFEVYADADVRALIEHRCAPYMPPSLALSGAGPP